MELSVFLNGVVAALGGASVIIVAGVVVGAYNQWRMRLALEELRDITKHLYNTTTNVVVEDDHEL